MTLQVLKQLLRLLSFCDVTRSQRDRINSLGGVRLERLGAHGNEREPDLILLANVPVTHSVEIHVSHVVAINLAHLLAVLDDLTDDVVLCLSAKHSWLVVSCDTVSLVSVLDLSCQLMAHSAHEEVVEGIIGVSVRDLLTVFKNNSLVTFGGQVGRVHTSFDGEGRPPIHYVVIVGTIKLHVSDRRMMAGLLYVDLATVLSVSFERLSKNRVQGLLEDLLRPEKRYRLRHDQLHSLDGVANARSVVQVDRASTLKGGHEFEHGSGAHAFDWETNFRQIEASAQNLLAGSHDKFFTSTSQSVLNFSVQKLETSIIGRLFAPVIIFQVVVSLELFRLGDKQSSFGFLFLFLAQLFELGFGGTLVEHLSEFVFNFNIVFTALQLVGLNDVHVQIFYAATVLVNDIPNHLGREIRLLEDIVVLTHVHVTQDLKNLIKFLVNFALISH